jgi:hypothetical protein
VLPGHVVGAAVAGEPAEGRRSKMKRRKKRKGRKGKGKRKKKEKGKRKRERRRKIGKILGKFRKN